MARADGRVFLDAAVHCLKDPVEALVVARSPVVEHMGCFMQKDVLDNTVRENLLGARVANTDEDPPFVDGVRASSGGIHVHSCRFGPRSPAQTPQDYLPVSLHMLVILPHHGQILGVSVAL